MTRGIILGLLVSAVAFGDGVLFQDSNEPIRYSTVEVQTAPEMIAKIASIEAAYNKGREESEDAEDLISEVLLDKIINMGKKVWSIIEKNQPVLNVEYKYADALPTGVKGPEDLDQFSNLQYKSFQSYGKNGFGINVYTVNYTVVHRYGGRFNDRGQYLSNVSVLPSTTEALWGYNVGLAVDRISTTNVGTRENPVAGMAMQLKFSVSTVIKKGQYVSLFDIRGDSGRITEVTN